MNTIWIVSYFKYESFSHLSFLLFWKTLKERQRKKRKNEYQALHSGTTSRNVLNSRPELFPWLIFPQVIIINNVEVGHENRFHYLDIHTELWMNGPNIVLIDYVIDLFVFNIVSGLSLNLVVWCATIQSKTKKIWKTSEMTRKTSKNDDFLIFFQSFLVFGPILVHQTTKFKLSG